MHLLKTNFCLIEQSQKYSLHMHTIITEQILKEYFRQKYRYMYLIATVTLNFWELIIWV